MSSLQDFLVTYNDIKGRKAYEIDPLNTFKLYIRENSHTKGETNSLTNLALDNLGITDFEEKDWLTMFVQSITTPAFNIIPDTEADTVAGSFTTHTMKLNPSGRELSLEVINTKRPIIENFFYPWLRQVQSPKWIFEEVPYATADLIVDMTEHNNLKYHFINCRPTQLETLNPKQALSQELTRTMQITFDFATVETNGKVAESNINKLVSKLINKTLKTIGL